MKKITHEQVEKRNMIEDYVLGRLNNNEESVLEEHMIECEDCRSRCLVMENIIRASEQRIIENDNPVLPEQKKETFPGPYFRKLLQIAAAFLVIAGFLYFLFNANKNDNKKIRKNITVSNIDSTVHNLVSDSVHNQNDKIAEHDRSTGKKHDGDYKTPEENLLLTEAFTPSPVFESAIRNHLRSFGIRVISPGDSAIFKVNHEIEFKWQTDSEQDLTLIIRKNTGEIISKNSVPSVYSGNIARPGLYYWQLLNDDDIIYTGKLYVK
jgi:hypothetical protein